MACQAGVMHKAHAVNGRSGGGSAGLNVISYGTSYGTEKAMVNLASLAASYVYIYKKGGG